MTDAVVVSRIDDKAVSQYALIHRALETLNASRDLGKADAVFVKPNLTYPRFKAGVTTRVEFVEDVVRAIRDIRQETVIYIGEGDGGYNSFSMTKAMKTMAFTEIQHKYGNVKLVNLSELPSQRVELSARGKPYAVDLPRLFFDEIDIAVTCAVPKVHCMTGISLSLKNQWGCLPDIMRLKNHYVFEEIIGQICSRLKFRYALLDGKYGLDNNGPMVGDAVELNWFAASNSLGAFDIVVSEMMGVDWRKIRHLRKAEEQGLMPKRDKINVIGDIGAVKRRFRLKRDPWNYLALLAFHSKNLTQIVYMSRFSKIIHDVMYTFRERPVTE